MGAKATEWTAGGSDTLTTQAVTARAFWTVAPGVGEIRTSALPRPGPGEVLVESLFSAVSRGTESLVFAGRVPESEFARMRAPFQDGAFPFPVKYGYANVGRVVAGAPALTGATVFVLYPHQTAYVVPAEALYVVPDSVPAGRAILAANLETAVNALWDGSPRVGDRVRVVGAGTVGSLVAWLAARIVGCQVELIDIDPSRAAVADALGVPFRTPETATGDADLVVHASSSPAGLAQALRLAGFEATVLELSWYGSALVPVPLGEAFHSRRLDLRSSQVGHVAASQRGRWDTRRRMGLVLDLLADPVLDALVTGESPFEDLPSLMPMLASGASGTLCHRIRY